MENLEKGIEVSQLIVKDLQGCISPEEKVMLDKWLEESPENREVYHRVQGRVRAFSSRLLSTQRTTPGRFSASP